METSKTTKLSVQKSNENITTDEEKLTADE